MESIVCFCKLRWYSKKNCLVEDSLQLTWLVWLAQMHCSGLRCNGGFRIQSQIKKISTQSPPSSLTSSILQAGKCPPVHPLFCLGWRASHRIPIQGTQLLWQCFSYRPTLQMEWKDANRSLKLHCLQNSWPFWFIKT